MEVINSQIGQTFAVSSLSSADSAETRNLAQERQAESERVASSEADNGVNTSSQQLSAEVQENFTPADNIEGEQRPESIELEEASREIEQFLQSQNRNLAFSVDQSTERSVVTVTEADSGDVIRQIPSEEILRLAERLRDLQTDVGSSVGVLFNNQV